MTVQMNEPAGHEEPAGPPGIEPVPIPVSGQLEIRKIHGAVPVHQEAADFGAVFTITFTGTEAPQQLLPYDPGRARAYITCGGTGPVYIGSRDAGGLSAVRTNGLPGGQAPVYVLSATGGTLPITHKQAVYISPDGTHSATVSVSVERWQPS